MTGSRCALCPPMRIFLCFVHFRLPHNRRPSVQLTLALEMAVRREAQVSGGVQVPVADDGRRWVTHQEHRSTPELLDVREPLALLARAGRDARQRGEAVRLLRDRGAGVVGHQLAVHPCN